MSRGNYVVEALRRRAKSNAVKKTAEKFRMSTAEVRRLVKLGGLYAESIREEIEKEGDWYEGTNRWQLPGVNSFVRIGFIPMLINMREHGHITEDQWKRLVLPKKESAINNYLKDKDERTKQYQKVVSGRKTFDKSDRKKSENS